MVVNIILLGHYEKIIVILVYPKYMCKTAYINFSRERITFHYLWTSVVAMKGKLLYITNLFIYFYFSSKLTYLKYSYKNQSDIKLYGLTSIEELQRRFL